jgi:pyridoxal phosphate enzyme (YggS family)
VTTHDLDGTAADFASRLARVRAVVDGVERPWRHPVEIVAVTKGFGPDAIERAVAGGAASIGENYAQELIGKRAVIERCRPRVHFIGHLQTNKVRQLVDLVDVWSTLDRRSVVDEVARRAPGATVLVQVNSTGEAAKSGCPPEDVPRLVEDAVRAGLLVRGLMTVGPTSGDPAATAAAFASTRRLVDELGLVDCSMGMSGDLELAVAAGSTQVRIGTALFGPRPPKPDR